MSVVDIIGWLAAATTASLAVPQGARIAFTRSVSGVSTTTWQTMLIAGLAWTVHGLMTGTPQVIWPNIVLGLTAAWVLWQLTVAQRLPVARTWLLPAAIAAAAVAIDAIAGPLAFGIAAFVPGAIGQISQLRAILRVPDPSGVSMAALVLGLANQALWFSFSLPKGELAIIASSAPIGVLVSASIVALWRRRHVRDAVNRPPDADLPPDLDAPPAACPAPA